MYAILPKELYAELEELAQDKEQFVENLKDTIADS